MQEFRSMTISNWPPSLYLNKGNLSLVEELVVFLSDALEVKLGYDLSIGSTRTQPLFLSSIV